MYHVNPTSAREPDYQSRMNREASDVSPSAFGRPDETYLSDNAVSDGLGRRRCEGGSGGCNGILPLLLLLLLLSSCSGDSCPARSGF